MDGGIGGAGIRDARVGGFLTDIGFDTGQEPEEDEPIESSQRAENEEEKDAEFDDSPFDAASGQRFD